jgi:tetratricopeptide (TPR) repeat protein
VTLGPPSTDSPTQGLIDFLLDRVAAEPDDGDAQLELGLALLQRVRETADPSLYAPAEAALTAARRLLPDDPAPLVGLGGLQLGRHDFAAALETGRAAVARASGSASAEAIVIDALIELGRYDDAFPAAERLAARSPDLSSLARLSYALELRGDLPGALAAMRQAATAPSTATENTAYVLSILGQLERFGGDPAAARTAFYEALALVPDHAPSLAGLGRLAVGEGDLVGAADRFERAAAVLPLPEYVIALGETREAAGDRDGARRQFDLARAEIDLFRANGVAVDLELALFEADHGDPEAALRYARSAYEAAPTVKAADALAWALHRAGRTGEARERAREALRLGSREPLFLYHAGTIEVAAGDPVVARRHLTDALALDPGFSATGAQHAREALAALPTAD